MSDLDNERDDFWNIDKLVPKKKPQMTQFATKPTVTDHNVNGIRKSGSEELKLSFSNMTVNTEDTSYVPRGKSLLKRVTIKRYVDKYDFYGSFRNAALVYYDYKSEKCEFAPYYSYMPQYSQLTAPQKNYYFYWRDEVRRSRYIKCDYSYIYLYVYEILNLPDKTPPEEGIRLLCRLWREYRRALPRIDSYFSIWVQDYCLIYNLDCPMDEIREFIFDVISASNFKEFYLSDIECATTDGIDAMLAYLSDYDWRRGKYSAEGNPDFYKSHMHGAMRLLTSYLLSTLNMADFSVTSLISRDAFPHSLCTHTVKSKLEIEYIPLSRDERLREAVTLGVRYTENKLRAIYGIKSRLAVKNFPDEYKRIIDNYFSVLLEREQRRAAREAIPEYEKLYDAPSESLSFAGADEIERASWSTTARLVDDIENCDENIEQSDILNAVTSDLSSEVVSDSYGLSGTDISFVRLALSDGMSDDSAAERINEAFSDGFGDIILEFDGEKYRVIDDYVEEVKEWLLKLTK